MNSYINFYGEDGKYAQCDSLYSCTNVTFVSNPSYAYAPNYEPYLKTRTIIIYFAGPFSGYNSTIDSNGNNVYVEAESYYAVYGLTLRCNGHYDVCVVTCYGNSCVGLTMICDSSISVACDIECGDNSCNNYDYTSKNIIYVTQNSDEYNINDYNYRYDGMVDVIDEIVFKYDNYNSRYRLITLSPKNLTYVDLITDVRYCQNSDNYNYNIINVCCLAGFEDTSIKRNCSYSYNINYNYNYNLYCGGWSGCDHSNWTDFYNVYGLASFTLTGVNIINIDGVVFCVVVMHVLLPKYQIAM